MYKHTFVKKDLQDRLRAIGKDANGTKKDLQKRCEDNEIAISEMRRKVKEGWMGKPKGMLQVLWERGFIDPTVEVSDFLNEKTLLQFHAEARSRDHPDGCQVMFDRSPKCHPELAGEGIEYDWAGVKSYYRRSPLHFKKGAANFKALVLDSLKSVTFEARVAFSARAREYMLAYDVLEEWENLPANLKTEEKLPETSAQLLDSVVRSRKRHRSVRTVRMNLG
mmetsp:Transcript_33708/g.81727  ORF Transcript_33708/g.81727 Transcript_33708/m.81727 type:complete len:222 (+) Transcript_33708:463-1128(+)